MGGTSRCPRLRAGLDGKGQRVQGSCAWPGLLEAIALPSFPLPNLFSILFWGRALCGMKGVCATMLGSAMINNF